MAQVFAPSLDRSPLARVAGPPTVRLPHLAAGVELIGRYEDSGFEDGRYIAKRADGQVVQLTHLLFLVATHLGSAGDAEAVACAVSRDYGREVSAENVAFLVAHKLVPAGLVGTPGADAVSTAAPNPVLALKLRLPLVPERVHRHVTKALRPLFWPPLTVAAAIALVALDAWLIADLGSGIMLATQFLIYQPQLLLPITALTLLMVAFHEIGHATAARYGGARPGAMGAGIYLVWPVFYTDVTDAYRLDRRGRLRVDLGGIYFNVLFTLGIAGLYVATDHVVFVVFIVVAQVETLRQFLPFIRLDGYYIVCDLAGVPNLFEYLRPAVAQVIRFGRRDARHASSARKLQGLTRRARVMLTVWACVTAPVLAVNVAMLLFAAPRVIGAAWGSAGRQAAVLGDAFHRAAASEVLGSVIGLVQLVLPAAGMAYIVARMGGRVRRSVQRSWHERPITTAALLAAAGTLVVFQVGFVWPDSFAAAAQHPRPEQLTTRTQEIVRPAGGGTTGEVTPAPLPAPAVTGPPADHGRPAPPSPQETGVAAPITAATPAADLPDPGTPAPPPAPASSGPSTGPAASPAAADGGATPGGPAPAAGSPAAAEAPAGTQAPAATPPSTAAPAPAPQPGPTTTTTVWTLDDLLPFLPQ